jgi:hypothetical protein
MESHLRPIVEYAILIFVKDGQHLIEKISKSKLSSRTSIPKMAASEFIVNATHLEEFPRSTWNNSISFEEDDPDTIRVHPLGVRKRRRQDSGVHLDEGFERLPSQVVELSENKSAHSENGVDYCRTSPGMMKQPSPVASNGDQGGQGNIIKQSLTGADQMVLFPVATLKRLENEIAELRTELAVFKGETQKQFHAYDDALNSQLGSAEIGSADSDSDDDSCSDQAMRDDSAARKVAVNRVRRLARDHHHGEQRAHLEFMADIAGVKNKSKVAIGLFQVLCYLQRLTVVSVTFQAQNWKNFRSKTPGICPPTSPRRLRCPAVEAYL